MLFSLKSSSLRCPLRPLHTRSLTTFPKPTSTYLRTWNPTKYSLPHPLKDSSSLRNNAGNTLEHDARNARKTERERLRDMHGVEVTRKTEYLDQKQALRRLNRFLRFVHRKGFEGRVHFRLWRAYSLAKRHVPTLPCSIPDKAWDLLWSAQASNNPDLRNRRQHLEELYLDMHSVGKSITVGQRVAYLESVFLNGKEEQALKEWEQDRIETNASSRQDYKPEHLELGARLYALAGNPDRAMEVMEELFDLYPAWDISVMKIVFRAHTTVESEKHHDIARTIYLKIKESLGTEMRLEDYDACFVGFLEARNLHYAKQVFRDMVRDGKLAHCLSREHVETVLHRLHKLYHLGTDIEKMTSIALTAISTLPQAYHAHVFGDWMKLAVVKKAPEAAAQILDMMHNRGYQPQTVHFNLLLKALLRTKDKPRILKAENIGWRMIEESRKSSPKERSGETAPDIISRWVVSMSTNKLDSEAVKCVPMANVSTFALMMQHHAGRLQWEHVDYLARQMKENGMQPNTPLMNILMDNLCRRGKYGEAWRTYKSLTDIPELSPGGVFPDGASMRCLWKILRLALGDHATRNDPDLPTPRELLAETVHWWARCRSRHDAQRFRMGLAAADNGAITSLMMHCFSYTQDFAGSLVALHVMRTNLKIFPNDKAAAILQNQAAWVDMHRETQSVRSQYHLSNVNKKNFEKLGRVYYILMEKRFERMNITGDQYAYLSEEEVGDLGLNLLSEFVRVVLKRSYPPEAVEAMIDKAKKEVGVPDMPTGDMDAFSVS